MVNHLLRGLRVGNGALFHGRHLPVHERRCTDDRDRPAFADGKRYFFSAFRFLYRLFFPVPLSGKSERRLYTRCLQTGNLLCACHTASPIPLGNKRHSLRPAGCRCYLRHDHRVYGGAAPQGTERSKVVAFVSLHRTECREATELLDSSAAGILPVQNSLSCMCIRTLFLQISFCQIIKLHPAFYLSALRRHGAEYFQSHFRPLLPCGRIDEIDGPHIVKPVGQCD